MAQLEAAAGAAQGALMLEAWIDPATGQRWLVHEASECAGQPYGCPFHRPSAHRLRDAPIRLQLIGHAGGRRIDVVQRVCRHDAYHTDPDSFAWVAANFDLRGGDLQLAPADILEHACACRCCQPVTPEQWREAQADTLRRLRTLPS